MAELRTDYLDEASRSERRKAVIVSLDISVWLLEPVNCGVSYLSIQSMVYHLCTSVRKDIYNAQEFLFSDWSTIFKRPGVKSIRLSMWPAWLEEDVQRRVRRRLRKSRGTRNKKFLRKEKVVDEAVASTWLKREEHT